MSEQGNQIGTSGIGDVFEVTDTDILNDLVKMAEPLTSACTELKEAIEAFGKRTRNHVDADNNQFEGAEIAKATRDAVGALNEIGDTLKDNISEIDNPVTGHKMAGTVCGIK